MDTSQSHLICVFKISLSIEDLLDFGVREKFQKRDSNVVYIASMNLSSKILSQPIKFIHAPTFDYGLSRLLCFLGFFLELDLKVYLLKIKPILKERKDVPVWIDRCLLSF